MGGTADAAAGSTSVRSGDDIDVAQGLATIEVDEEGNVLGGGQPNVVAEISASGEFQFHDPSPNNTPPQEPQAGVDEG